MPSRKKKYNARFPAGRIKKIMQSDEEIGKVAQAVPVIISRTLELFVESLLKKSLGVTNTRNAKTISISHMKYTIMQESRFDFLRELVKNIPDMGISDDGYNDDSNESPEEPLTTTPNINYYSDNPQDQPINLSCNRASTSRSHLNGNSAISTTTTLSNSAAVGNSSSYIQNSTSLPTTLPVQQHPKQYSIYNNSSSTSNSSTSSTRNSGRNVQQQSSLSSTSSTLVSDANENNALRLSLKRQWQNVSRMRGQIADNDHSKFIRTNSAPSTSADPAPAIHGQATTSNQRSRGRTRGVGGGLLHQPQSVPCTPATPLSPLVKIEFTNEPIIKIDFTNTNLQDSSHSNSNSTATCRRGDNNKGTSSACSDLGPVINIDLSNICTLTTPNNNKIPTVSTPAVTAAPMPSSILELDEDYDNI